MLRAIVNFPALCQQFRNSLKKLRSKSERKTRHNKDVHTLRTYGLDEHDNKNVEALDELAK